MTGGGWWIYMNQNTDPFTDQSVRAAVVHAINYGEIINVAFGKYATRWVGPVPPGYPNYNPANVPMYQYDLNLARQEMNNSPWPLTPTGGGFPVFFQAEDGIRDLTVTGVQTCALPI